MDAQLDSELAYKLGAQLFIDTKSSEVVKELKKLGGAKAILATDPDNKAVSELINDIFSVSVSCLVDGLPELCFMVSSKHRHRK